MTTTESGGYVEFVEGAFLLDFSRRKAHLVLARPASLLLPGRGSLHAGARQSVVRRKPDFRLVCRFCLSFTVSFIRMPLCLQAPLELRGACV